MSIFTENQEPMFASKEHYEFFKQTCERLNADCYLKALIYTVGISEDTRSRWSSFYDEKERTIKPEVINSGWQTSGSVRITRLAFQLFTDSTPTAIDYDKNAATTRRFYATVQNKMHYAVHGHTAAEMIVERADHTKEHMGLTTWADAPDGKIKKSDVTVAKNYLSQDEMKQLNRMVTAYLDFAENMTLRHIPLTMQDWEKRLNSFIEMFDYGILQDAGKVSAEIAKLHAETEFEKYRVIQDRLFMSDFDKYMLELEENTKK